MPHIEIDGRTIEVAPGTTIMEAAGALGIYIPFFCYHPKLSVAANCRMCLVDVEKAPKPLPACATPVADGMKIATSSRKAKTAQQGVLEFLLINHPLDCPICDQGGECPLQDITMGFANPHSHYTEEKRVVEDKDIGPLITTEMTRCIQCTRCVRFGQEIGGIMELGATGRGEHMSIGTYVAKAVRSELSGNMIDLCPVGALTSKPFRYKARSWELKHTPGLCPHCSTGCNTDVHSLGREVLRVLPHANQAVNEDWICDKGRYAYTGLQAEDRVTQPLLRVDGVWREVSWVEAVDAALSGLEQVVTRHGAERLAGFISAQSSNEELFLFQALLRGLGSPHVDHRLRQRDFRADVAMPIYPALNMALEELEREPVVLLCHAFPRHQQPLTNHRLRKSVLQGGKVIAVDSLRQDFNYPVTQLVADVGTDATLYAALCDQLSGASGKRTAAPDLADVASTLLAADNPLILIGSALLHHPQAAVMIAQIETLAELAGGRVGWLADEANSAGAWLSGCVPHRLPGGHAAHTAGLPADSLWDADLRGFVLLGIEPSVDAMRGAAALAALQKAQFVLSIAQFAGEAKQYADVILPMAAFAEGAGSFINNEGRLQSFRAAIRTPGEVRPAWKILRVLGDGLKLPGFHFNALSEVTAAWQRDIGEYAQDVPPFHAFPALEPVPAPKLADALYRLGDWPIYRGDPLVRRAVPLAQPAMARMHPDQFKALDLRGDVVEVSSHSGKVTLPLILDARIPMGAIWVPLGYSETAALGAAYAACSVRMATRPVVAAARA